MALGFEAGNINAYQFEQRIGEGTYGKVYRGVHDMVLPKHQFWEANAYGVRGGIEAAFLSTTRDEATALGYAKGTRGGFVFEIQQGMIDRGADIGFLSQYPFEEEVLFAPLTYLRPTDKEQAVFHLPSAGNTLTVVEVNPRG